MIVLALSVSVSAAINSSIMSLRTRRKITRVGLVLVVVLLAIASLAVQGQTVSAFSVCHFTAIAVRTIALGMEFPLILSNDICYYQRLENRLLSQGKSAEYSWKGFLKTSRKNCRRIGLGRMYLATSNSST